LTKYLFCSYILTSPQSAAGRGKAASEGAEHNQNKRICCNILADAAKSLQMQQTEIENAMGGCNDELDGLPAPLACPASRGTAAGRAIGGFGRSPADSQQKQAAGPVRRVPLTGRRVAAVGCGLPNRRCRPLPVRRGRRIGSILLIAAQSSFQVMFASPNPNGPLE
jgi:hypothetical protein